MCSWLLDSYNWKVVEIIVKGSNSCIALVAWNKYLTYALEKAGES